jgi:aryl-alcohol dehydrogenase-like predicted oxidoreductase
VDETLSALSDLIRIGNVRAVGTSSFPPSEIVEAHWVAERRALERFRTEQALPVCVISPMNRVGL